MSDSFIKKFEKTISMSRAFDWTNINRIPSKALYKQEERTNRELRNCSLFSSCEVFC